VLVQKQRLGLLNLPCNLQWRSPRVILCFFQPPLRRLLLELPCLWLHLLALLSSRRQRLRLGLRLVARVRLPRMLHFSPCWLLCCAACPLVLAVGVLMANLRLGPAHLPRLLHLWRVQLQLLRLFASRLLW
jgi:hypothetical protein